MSEKKFNSTGFFSLPNIETNIKTNTEGRDNSQLQNILIDIEKNRTVYKLITLAFLLYLNGWLFSPLSPIVAEGLKDLGLAVVIGMVAFKINAIFEKTVRKPEICANVKNLIKLGALSLYTTRKNEKLDEEMADCIKKEKEIYVIGVSLKTLTGTRNVLKKTKKAFLEKINGISFEDKDKVKVKVLLIDPMSFEAKMRKITEDKKDDESDLFEDVESSIVKFYKKINALRDEAKKAGKSTDFKDLPLECKLYKTSPINFLIWTPSCAYLQYYLYQDSSHKDLGLPIIKYINSYNAENSIHSELETHFNTLWDGIYIENNQENNNKYKISEYLHDAYELKARHSHNPRLRRKSGILDEAVEESNIKNMYSLRDKAKLLIEEKLRTARDKVYILGIALTDFFEENRKHAYKYTDFYSALMSNPGTKPDADKPLDVRALLLDPDQANGISKFMMEKDTYAIKDAKQSEENIRKLFAKGEVPVKFTAKKYHSISAYCFLLLIDDSVFVEQYHVGEVKEKTRGILGKHLPIIQYERIDDNSDAIHPYKIFESHFGTIFKDENYTTIIETTETPELAVMR